MPLTTLVWKIRMLKTLLLREEKTFCLPNLSIVLIRIICILGSWILYSLSKKTYASLVDKLIDFVNMAPDQWEFTTPTDVWTTFQTCIVNDYRTKRRNWALNPQFYKWRGSSSSHLGLYFLSCSLKAYETSFNYFNDAWMICTYLTYIEPKFHVEFFPIFYYFLH